MSRPFGGMSVTLKLGALGFGMFFTPTVMPSAAWEAKARTSTSKADTLYAGFPSGAANDPTTAIDTTLRGSSGLKQKVIAKIDYFNGTWVEGGKRLITIMAWNVDILSLRSKSHIDHADVFLEGNTTTVPGSLISVSPLTKAIGFQFYVDTKSNDVAGLAGGYINVYPKNGYARQIPFKVMLNPRSLAVRTSYYVSPTGTDAAGNGLSASTPVKTIQYALTKVVPSNKPAELILKACSASANVAFAGDLTSGSVTVANVASIAGLFVGQGVTGAGLYSGTQISGISGSAAPYTVTLSQAARTTVAGVALTGDRTVHYPETVNSGVAYFNTNLVPVVIKPDSTAYDNQSVMITKPPGSPVASTGTRYPSDWYQFVAQNIEYQNLTFNMRWMYKLYTGNSNAANKSLNFTTSCRIVYDNEDGYGPQANGPLVDDQYGFYNPLGYGAVGDGNLNITYTGSSTGYAQEIVDKDTFFAGSGNDLIAIQNTIVKTWAWSQDYFRSGCRVETGGDVCRPANGMVMLNGVNKTGSPTPFFSRLHIEQCLVVGSVSVASGVTTIVLANNAQGVLPSLSSSLGVVFFLDQAKTGLYRAGSAGYGAFTISGINISTGTLTLPGDLVSLGLAAGDHLLHTFVSHNDVFQINSGAFYNLENIVVQNVSSIGLPDQPFIFGANNSQTTSITISVDTAGNFTLSATDTTHIVAGASLAIGTGANRQWASILSLSGTTGVLSRPFTDTSGNPVAVSGATFYYTYGVKDMAWINYQEDGCGSYGKLYGAMIHFLAANYSCTYSAGGAAYLDYRPDINSNGSNPEDCYMVDSLIPAILDSNSGAVATQTSVSDFKFDNCVATATGLTRTGLTVQTNIAMPLAANWPTVDKPPIPTNLNTISAQPIAPIDVYGTARVPGVGLIGAIAA